MAVAFAIDCVVCGTARRQRFTCDLVSCVFNHGILSLRRCDSS